MKEYITLSEELNKLSGERQANIKARDSQIYLEELTLKYLQLDEFRHKCDNIVGLS